MGHGVTVHPSESRTMTVRCLNLLGDNDHENLRQGQHEIKETTEGITHLMFGTAR